MNRIYQGRVSAVEIPNPEFGKKDSDEPQWLRFHSDPLRAAELTRRIETLRLAAESERKHRNETTGDKPPKTPLLLEYEELQDEARAAWETALWQHHALFQDAVNYYLVCLLALAGPGNAVFPIREKLDAYDELGNPDELMVWRAFRRRDAIRRGLRDSVVPYLCPDKKDATPEDCFAAVLVGNECALNEEGRKRLDAGLTQLLKNCKGESGCRDSAKEYLPRFCRTKTRCNYPESPIALRREYQDELFPFVLHSAATPDSLELRCFNTFTIALPDYSESRFVGERAKEMLGEMIDDWRKKLPSASADFDRLANLIRNLSATVSIPGYAGTSAKGEKRFRLYAMFFFRYLERSAFTLGLLRQTTPKPKEKAERPTPPTREVLMAGDPVQRSRGARRYVFRAFTSLPCWDGAEAGEPTWMRFDEMALQEALKALNQVGTKKEERRLKRENLVRRHLFMRGKIKTLPKPKGDNEQTEAEPSVLAGDPRIEQLKQVVDVDLREEYEMSEGVSVRYGLHQRTLRGYHELQKKWNEILDKRREKFAKRNIEIHPDKEFSESRRKRLLGVLRKYQKDNPNIVGSVRLFEELLEQPNWIIWREPTAKQRDEWRKKWKRAKDAEFCKNPLQALTDERELVEEVRRLRLPIRFTPADPEHSRRQFYFYDGSHRPARGRMPHDKQILDTEIARAVNGVWKCDSVRIEYEAPRLLRDQLATDASGTASQFQQAMMAALNIKTGLTKTKSGKTVAASFSDCAAVALMPEAMPTPEQRAMLDRLAKSNPSEIPTQMALVKKRLLLNFPIDLDAVEIPKQFLTLKGRQNLFKTRKDPLTEKLVFDSYWEKQTVASYTKRKLDGMFHLRWEATWHAEKKDRKEPLPNKWWNEVPSFSCLAVDLGQRDAGAFALLEATPGSAPKAQSRKIGSAEGKTWWATVRATGMLHLPGEDAKLRRARTKLDEGDDEGVNGLEELSGARGRNLVAGEWAEARDICEKLGFLPDKMLGTDERRRSFPELNNELLYALRRAQSRLARLQSWSCVAYEEPVVEKRAAFEKRRARIKEQIEEAITSRAAEEKKDEKDRGQESLERSAWLREVEVFAGKHEWVRVRDCIIREIKKERGIIQRELLRIADRIQPLRGRRWAWVPRPDDPKNAPKNYLLQQTERGSDDRAKLLAGQRGLSMKRIEQLESLRQRCQSLNRAFQHAPGGRPPQGSRTRGKELPDPCPELLDRLEALKDQRVNQTAHLILAQALGVRLRPHAKDTATRAAQNIHGEYERIPGREPVDFLVLENLDRYLASQGRGRGENSKLMKWSHRAILGKLKQLCEPYGLRVLETPAAYSSRFCSLSGVAGFPAVELTPEDANEFRWKKHLYRLADPERAKKLGREEQAESERVKAVFDALKKWNEDLTIECDKARAEGRAFRPKWRTLLAPVAGGPIFVPASAVEHYERKNPKTGKNESAVRFSEVEGRRPVVGQADINAAINLGLRAIASPDADDIHLRIRAARKDEGFVVRAENAREKARWKEKAGKIAVPKEADRKKLLADAHLNFFTDLGNVADYDAAQIDGKGGYASGRGIWGTIKGGKDWRRVEAVNNARIRKWKESKQEEDNIPFD